MVRKLTKFSYQCGYKISLEVLAAPKIVSELESKFCPLLEKRWLFLNHGNKNIIPSRKLTINFRQIISFQDRSHRQPSRIYIGQFQQIRSKKLKKIRNVAQGVGIGYLVNPCLENKDPEKQAMKFKDCKKPRRFQDETDAIIPIKNSSKKIPKRPAMDAWNPSKCPIYKGHYDAYNRKFDQTSCTSSCFWPRKNQDLYNRKSYTGCWKNGLFHGNGHIIYHDGSIYKGKFVEGERNGPGTFYYPVGKTNRVLIRGVFEPFGYGAVGKLSTDSDHPVTVIFTNGNVFTGQVDPSNHVLSGQGTVLFAENDRKNRKMFVGNFQKNTFHGFGTMTYSKPTVKNLYDILNNPVSYQGNWVYGQKDGKALVKFSDSYPNTVTSFSGDYANDVIVNNDVGNPAKWTFKNGDIFIGNMKEIFDRDGYTKYLVKCNRGRLIYAKNSTSNPEKISEYTGHFRQNRWNLPETLPKGPPGVMIWRNGANYTGKFIDNFRTDNTGQAIYFYPKRKKSKKLKYVGQFLKNKFQNNGKIYYKNGNSYQGHFHQNKMHGEGKFCYQKKKVCSVGEYWDDKKEGEFKFTKITDGSYFTTKFHGGKEMKQYREYYDDKGRRVSGKKMKHRRTRKNKGRRRRKINRI